MTVKYIFIGHADEMMVTWVTVNKTTQSAVEYGLSGLNMQTLATQSAFVDGGLEKRIIYIHRALLQKLKPGRKYCKYTCMITPERGYFHIF